MPVLPTILRTINMDCSDPQAMARFYGGLLGWEPTVVEPDWVLMRDPDGGTGLSFQRTEGYAAPTWPEAPGQQQKMIHLELPVRPREDGDYTEEEGRVALEKAAQAAKALGATLAEHQPRTDIRVMLDPSGHPLCLFLD